MKVAYFFALLFAALVLGPSLAHLLELPNKIDLPEIDYFTVQRIYRGWALLGVVILGALTSTLILAILLCRERAPRNWTVLALLCLVAGQAIFWTYTYPANQATENWTRIPQDWLALRSQWEYSHGAGAILNIIAMVALILSVLAWSDGGRATRGQ